MASTETFDVIVFGGGSGLTTASLADEAGKSVCVIEKGPLGGTCENRGCIPTKGVIQSANVMKTIREAGQFGIRVDMDSVSVDFAAVMQAVRDRRKQRTDGARKWVEETFTLVADHATFVDEKTLKAGNREVSADTVFLGTGASPSAPPVSGLDEVDHWTNEDVLELDERPDELVILGGGYIGAEFAHFFHQMGTTVRVVEAAECLLREDADVRHLFTEQFKTWVELHNGWRAEAVAQDGDRFTVTIGRDGGQTKHVTGDALLVATGRTPNTRGLGLDKTGVRVDDRGFVTVDDYLRTTHDDIWSFGDVNGQQMFKHTAAYEAELAWRNSQGAQEKVDYSANPHAIFTDPEIGSVGMTEEEVKEAGYDYKVGKVDYGGVAKGQIVGAPPGFAKVLVAKKTDKILGFHMMGPHSAALIHEVVVAMSVGDGTASHVLDAIHQHPTMSELVKEAFVQAT